MNNKRQHSNPVYLSGFDSTSEARVLRAISLENRDTSETQYNEGWIQDLIFKHPQLLPVGEIEPGFFPLNPVCRELKTAAGYLDNLYVSDNGGLTLVECKLWRNPQARREVVGQILDYAKELSNWSYEDLNEAVSKASKRDGLFEIAAERIDGIEEAQFIDSVSKNLKRGRFLLLIVGDGIREGVENIANFLQVHAGLNFTFGLVELGLFRLPGQSGVIVQPRTIAQTYSIERAVLSVESEAIRVAPPEDQRITHKQSGRRTTLTEEEFFEDINALVPGLASEIKSFLTELTDLDIEPSFGSSSLNLRWQPEGVGKINFGSINTNGLVDTAMSLWALDQIGRVDIAHEYLEDVASLVDGAFIKKYDSGVQKVFMGQNLISLKSLLDNKQQWIRVIQKTQEKVIEALNQ